MFWSSLRLITPLLFIFVAPLSRGAIIVDHLIDRSVLDGSSQKDGEQDPKKAVGWSPSLTNLPGAEGPAVDSAIARVKLQSADPRLDAARDNYVKGNVKVAHTIINQLIYDAPDSMPLLVLRATMEFDLELYTNAVLTAQSATNAAPDSIMPLGILAPAFARIGDLERSEATYQRILKMEPKHAFTHDALGNLLYRQGRTDEAIHHFQQVVTNFPTHVAGLLKLGIALRETGATNQALVCVKRAVFVDPNHVNLYNELGVTCEYAGQRNQAKKAFAEAVARKATYSDAYSNLATLQDQDGEHLQAINNWMKALEIRIDLPTVWQKLIATLAKTLIRPTEAPALPNPPPDGSSDTEMAEAHYAQAIASLKQQAGELAHHHFLKALAFDINNPQYHNDYGALLAATGFKPLAHPFFKAALFLHPAYKEAQANLNNLDLQHREAQMLNRQYAAAHAKEIRAAKTSADVNTALAQLAKYPNNAQTNFDTAVAMAEDMGVSLALPYFHRAVKLKPNEETFRIGLSKAYSLSGNYEEALKEFQVVLKRHKTDPDYQNRLIWLILQQEEIDEKRLKSTHRLALALNERTQFKIPRYLETLISSYLAVEDTDGAMETARTILEIAQIKRDRLLEQQTQAKIQEILGLE